MKRGTVVCNPPSGSVFLLVGSPTRAVVVAGEVDISDRLYWFLIERYPHSKGILLYGPGSTRIDASDPITAELMDIARIARVLCG